MTLKRETSEALEQRDVGNGRDAHSHGAILRRRIMAVLLAVLCALIITIYFYHRSAYLRSAGDWRWFWVGEVFIGVWFIFAVVKVFRKGP